MRIPDNVKLHFETANLLMKGAKNSLNHIESLERAYLIPKEHSITSIKRRIVQIRQELQMVSDEIDEVIYNYEGESK